MKWVILCVLGAALGVGAWALHRADPGVAPLPARSSAVVVASDLAGYAFVPLRRLPRSPGKGPPGADCEGYRAAKVSAIGRTVEGAGWIVTSEAPLGRFHVVTFASGFDPGTSALCFARNANLAVFEGSALVALAYARRPYRGPDDSANPIPLGRAEPLEDGTGLLIWTDPPGVPVGELHLAGEGLRLTARSPQHSYCSGGTSLPDLYGKPIAEVRQTLLARGWQPQRPPEAPDDFERAPGGADADTAELEGCSGTGVGYCSWTFRDKAALLNVVTVGEDHTVSSYAVECRKH